MGAEDEGKFMDTYITIANNTRSNIDQVVCLFFEARQFSSKKYGPRNALNGQKIPAGTVLTRRVDILMEPKIQCSMPLSFNFNKEGLEDCVHMHVQCLHNGCCPNFVHHFKAHKIEFKEDKATRTITIIVNNTQDQLDDYEADSLQYKARLNMKSLEYRAAEAKLLTALDLGPKDQKIKNSIESDLKLVTDHLSDIDAKNLNNEAVEKANLVEYAVALNLLEKAEEKATNQDSINTIKKNKGRSFYELAKKCYDTAWLWDNYQKRVSSELVSKNFEEAKNKAEEAKKFIDMPDNKLLECIKMKMAADKEFDEGEEIQIAASEIYEETTTSNTTEKSAERKDFTDARKKYEEALVKFRAAGLMYEKGVSSDPKFLHSLGFVKERMKKVIEVIDSTIKADVDNGLLNIDSSEQKEIGESRSFIRRDKPEKGSYTDMLKNISSLKLTSL